MTLVSSPEEAKAGVLFLARKSTSTLATPKRPVTDHASDISQVLVAAKYKADTSIDVGNVSSVPDTVKNPSRVETVFVY